MEQGRIPLDDMRPRERCKDNIRCNGVDRSKPSATVVESSVQQETGTNQPRDSHVDGMLDSPQRTASDDDGSDTSDLITFTILDPDEQMSSKTARQPETPTLPMSIGLDSEDDFPYAFPGSDDPFSVSLLDSPHQGPSPAVTVLQNQLQNLRAQIRALKTEKQIADGRADLALERIAEMQDRHQEALQQTQRDTVNEYVDLQEQNRLLREQLSDAQSHIFSLQPYRKELTPDEIGRVSIHTDKCLADTKLTALKEYDEMLEKVQAWVENLMLPYLEDHEKGARQVLSWAKKSAAETTQFKKSLQAQPDLVHACMFPETDEDIVFSLVLRYLHDTIFQKILYGVLEQYTDVFSLVETHMQTSVEPKRGTL